MKNTVVEMTYYLNLSGDIRERLENVEKVTKDLDAEALVESVTKSNFHKITVTTVVGNKPDIESLNLNMALDKVLAKDMIGQSYKTYPEDLAEIFVEE